MGRLEDHATFFNLENPADATTITMVSMDVVNLGPSPPPPPTSYSLFPLSINL